MAFVKIFCWALIFLLKLRFPPGQSIAEFRQVGSGSVKGVLQEKHYNRALRTHKVSTVSVLFFSLFYD